MAELKEVEKTQNFRIITAFTNERYFKGGVAVLEAYPGDVEIARYRCVESGVDDSVWKFEK